ncbi:RNA polymerase factor sigma-54 [Paenibacillus roseipurpureus]|uniref:RNA polymerase factor sigma-54 n=1 Tax=Paenibacillus roseopurpureus TaxID=2918901 RepID=A0AA96LRX4_9BACL|nr:RNA polymerase factor sigma-54 [Paenibacillus sp. MBLB1832]WNR46124.1 RNA polymerase factor sigma-54 [Paenibacillus sp. MBLB1832]
MSMSMQQKQSQQVKLAMTPELRQSIHILQLSGYELNQFLLEQSVENPILEVEESPYLYRHIRSTGSMDASQTDPLLLLRAHEQSLQDYVCSQLRVQKQLTTKVRKFAIFLAGNLDEKGYLSLKLEECCDILGETMEVALEALSALQALDPAGIGARDVRECLLIQIRKDSRACSGALACVEHYLPQLAQGKYKEVGVKLKRSEQQIAEIHSYIKTLNPWPGGLYPSSVQPAYIIPDAYIRRDPNGFSIQVNTKYTPRVSMNPDYTQWVNDRQADASMYLKDKFKSASWLIKSLEQRNVTLHRVLQVLIDEQSTFLHMGLEHLRPLNLKAVAEKLGLHESTISRAVQNKYIQTPQGLIEMKFLFSTGLQTPQGNMVSISMVKHKMKEIVSQELKTNPYSDQQISEFLVAQGVPISRRTVAKYREELSIPVASMRKQRV